MPCVIGPKARKSSRKRSTTSETEFPRTVKFRSTSTRRGSTLSTLTFPFPPRSDVACSSFFWSQVRRVSSSIALSRMSERPIRIVIQKLFTAFSYRDSPGSQKSASLPRFFELSSRPCDSDCLRPAGAGPPTPARRYTPGCGGLPLESAQRPAICLLRRQGRCNTFRCSVGNPLLAPCSHLLVAILGAVYGRTAVGNGVKGRATLRLDRARRLPSTP